MKPSRTIKKLGAFIKNDILILIIIFLITLLFSMFLTQRFSFFWEDTYYFDIKVLGEDTNHFGIRTEHIKYNPPSELAYRFASIFFDYNSFLSMGYGYSPLMFYTFDLLPNLFGDNILFYHIYRAIIFSILICLLFYFIKKETDLYLAVMGSGIYMFYPEAWLALVFNVTVGLPMHLFTVLSLFLFYLYYYKNVVEKNEGWYSLKNILILLMILIACRISILIRNEGRIIPIIIILFLLIKHFNDYRIISKFIPLISTLMVISLPIIGIILHMINKNDIYYFPLNNGNDTFFELVTLFFKRMMIPINTLGIFLFFTTLSCIAIILFYSIKDRCKHKNHIKKQKNEYDLIIFSAVWLIMALGMVFMARHFDYPPKNFQRCDLIHVLIPFILLAISSIHTFMKRFKKNKKIACFFIFILILTMLLNLRNLNSYRGSWGEYFIGWDETIDYISEKGNNRVVLVPHTNGFASFYHPVDLIMTNDFNDITYLKTLKHDYSEVYLVNEVGIAGKVSLIKPSENVVLIKKLNVTDNSLYGKMKTVLKRKSKAEFWIYQYKDNNLMDKNLQ